MSGVLNFTKTDSLAIGDTIDTANIFRARVGEMAISRDGTILAVITDHGFSIIQTKISRFLSFASISARAQLRLRERTEGDSFRDSFEVEGSFVLDDHNNGIDPIGENVIMQIGSITMNIPAGSFQERGKRFRFKGTIDGVALEISLRALSRNRFHFVVHGDRADLSGSSIPLNVGWVIGDDRGTTKLNRGGAELQSGARLKDDHDGDDD